MKKREVRKGHFIGGLITFHLGLVLTIYYRAHVLELLKGALQPVFIIIGLIALSSVIFDRTLFKKTNLVLGALFLIIGLYGFYEEYHTVKDFISGVMPPFLIIVGIISLAYGIRKLTTFDFKRDS